MDKQQAAQNKPGMWQRLKGKLLRRKDQVPGDPNQPMGFMGQQTAAQEDPTLPPPADGNS